ncbi:MAG TPA: MraY family glycosyltransferase [Elusimicrobiota bacterium]|nr:MraY family glycosyltransferase [Elusimicrobiota bacterium]
MVNVYLMAFAVALVMTAALTPATIWLAKRFGVMDMPDPRKVHSVPIPRWGGLAMFIGFCSSLFSVWLVIPRFRQLLDFRHKILQGQEIIGMLSLQQQFAGIVVGACLVLILGMMDDRKPVPALPKLLIQIIASYAAMVYGVRIAGLAFPGHGFVEFPILLSQIVTVFWMIGFMNSINLVDGLDGLVAGLVAIAAGTFLVVCVLQGETKILLFAKQLKLAAVLAAAVSGACLGFLFFNFNPAKVFMGDGGALFLGFMLGAISVIGTLKTTAMMALFIPIFVVAVPVLDVAFAIFRRLRSGQGLMQPDRGHFHHRLLALGWTQREIVLLVYVLTLLLSMLTLLVTVFKGRI